MLPAVAAAIRAMFCGTPSDGSVAAAAAAWAGEAPEGGDILDHILAIDKQRNGEVEGKFGLYFDDESLRFMDSQDEAQPYDFMTEVPDVM